MAHAPPSPTRVHVRDSVPVPTTCPLAVKFVHHEMPWHTISLARNASPHRCAQVNQIGSMDAVIHNAGVFLEPSRGTTAEGHAKTLAVNTLAPYMLTALTGRPDRLIYLSSGLHHAGTGSLRDIDWTERSWNAAQAYAESKLYVTALALALARVWPEVLSNAVDPGWVPTKMGGPAATGDLQMGYLTQTWLAVSNDAAATATGGYWYHRQRQAPAAQARDPAFQDHLMDRLAALTGVALF